MGPVGAVSSFAVQVALDVDTGVDDALALIFAIRHPAIDLRAVSCVTGNVPVDQVVTNTLTVLDVLGAPDVPVARGAERPLVAPPPEGDSVHGRDGLADLGYPHPSRQAARMSAVELLARTINEATQPITLVGMAPLTNLAILFREHPTVVSRIDRVVLVGGGVGNRPGTAARGDFNLTADPEAAVIVLGCGAPIMMYSVELFRTVQLTRGEAERLAGAPDPVRRLAGRLVLHQVRRFGGSYGPIGDAGAMISLIARQGLTTVRRPIEIGRRGPRGQSLGRVPWITAPVDVAAAVDGSAYVRMFLDTLEPPA